MIAGHALLEAALVAAIVLGIKPLLTEPLFIRVVGVTGGLFLLFMGLSMIRSAYTGVEVQSTRRSDSGLSGVLAGALFSLSNPYWLIWWISIGAAYLVLALKFGLLGVVCFFFGHILADLLWYSLISFSVSYGRDWLEGMPYRLLMGSCGTFLSLLAATFISGYRLF